MAFAAFSEFCLLPRFFVKGIQASLSFLYSDRIQSCAIEEIITVRSLELPRMQLLKTHRTPVLIPVHPTAPQKGPYFLLVADLELWCQERNILIATPDKDLRAHQRPHEPCGCRALRHISIAPMKRSFSLGQPFQFLHLPITALCFLPSPLTAPQSTRAWSSIPVTSERVPRMTHSHRL